MCVSSGGSSPSHAMQTHVRVRNGPVSRIASEQLHVGDVCTSSTGGTLPVVSGSSRTCRSPSGCNGPIRKGYTRTYTTHVFFIFHKLCSTLTHIGSTPAYFALFNIVKEISFKSSEVDYSAYISEYWLEVCLFLLALHHAVQTYTPHISSVLTSDVGPAPPPPRRSTPTSRETFYPPPS